MPSAGTLASTRTPPARRFENYILTRIVDSSVGLTSVNNTQFTQVPGPYPFGPNDDESGAGAGGTDDSTSDVIPIGFDFQIDGITYTHWVANCNGWMALVDPVIGGFLPSEVMSGAVWVNENIRPTFGSRAVLLAPWFDDLKNIVNKPSLLLDSPYLYGATKVARITAGLEPPPIYYNPTSYGISYFLDSRSPKGRRLIIRWASVSNFATPQSVIRFEVVIYENGTIEYRYTPRQTIVTLPGPPPEGATIGIFMPNGTNRFRDFSAGLGYREGNREEYMYGGFAYDPSYFDGPFGEDISFGGGVAPYTVSLLTTQHWPGLNYAGCIMRFSPPVNRRKVLPRKLVRGMDSRLTLPLVARTGDSRLGTALSAYDDRKSPNYIGLSTSSPAATFGVQLDGLEWLLPRVADNGPSSYTTLDNVTVSETLSGDPNTVYNVQLRFRGVIEQKGYTGGTSDGAFFQTGGTPVSDSWNVYQLSISDPPQTYYVNKGTSGLHLVNTIDYTVSIPIRGNATVTLVADSGGDHQEIANNGTTGGPLSVAGVTSPAQPYLGQFVLMNYLGSSVLSSSTQTGIVTSKTQVNYPTTLPRFFGGTGLGTFERQDLMAGDFLVTGSVVKSAIDQYVNEAPITSIEAFNESSRHEQDPSTMTSDFYAAGSLITYVSNGFDQSLKSKTQVRFSLPVSYGTPLPASTSSIYYYNQRIKSWEAPANSTYVLSNAGSTPPSPNPFAGGDWGNAPVAAATGRLLEDARGFGPVGNIVSSGSNPLTGLNQSDVAINSPYDPKNIASVIAKTYPKSIRNNEEYRAVADETFTLPINAPFLIEKAVFEIPLAAGPGWFADQTQCFLPLGAPIDTAFDFAGPALTIALHRQVQLSENNPGPTVRDLILTGTITHQLDNVSQVVVSQFPPYDTTFQVRPVGFLAYAGPAGAVVNPNAQQQFTGSVVLEATSLSTAGVLVKFVKDFSGDTASNNRAGVKKLLTTTPTLVLGDNPSAPPQTVRVAYTAPFGRGGMGFQQAGRCVLGNEYVSFQGLSDQTATTVANPFNEAALTTQQLAALATSGFAARASAVIPLISHFQSPYLVMPGDKLVLSISKMRPFAYNSSLGAPPFSGSLQHDVVLTAGTINVTLYGSQLQAGVEYHDTLNQPLGSDAVHEIIGAEPVLDQFEVAYRNEFSGSFSDNVMLGTLGTMTFISQSSGVTRSYLKLQTTRDRKVSRLGSTRIATSTPDTRPNPTNVFGIPTGLSPFPLPAIKSYISVPAQLTTASADTAINPYKSFRLRPWTELNGPGTVRPTQFVDSTERFWDSMMPSIANCFSADGSGIFISPAGTFGDFRQVDIALTGSTSGRFDPNKGHSGWILFDNQNPSIMSTLGNIINGNWNKSFPFEPRYQNATRQLDIGKSFLATYIYQPGSSPVVQPIPPTPVTGFFFGSMALGTDVQNYTSEIQSIFGGPYILYFNNSPTYEWLADVNLSGKIAIPAGTSSPTMPSTVYATGSLNVEDAARSLFGFGDRNTHFLYNNTLLGTNHFPDARDVEGPHPDSYSTYYDNSNFRFSPVIRGWKYGVASGLPLFSKAYWRKGRFGQFRDMLEQRPFTKYYQSPENSKNVPNFQQGVQPAAVTVTFLDPSSGRLTAPDNTWSSNLHFECTSSLPFFDGSTSNRPTINPTILNLHPNVIRHDSRGNIHIA